MKKMLFSFALALTAVCAYSQVRIDWQQCHGGHEQSRCWRLYGTDNHREWRLCETRGGGKVRISFHYSTDHHTLSRNIFLFLRHKAILSDLSKCQRKTN